MSVNVTPGSGAVVSGEVLNSENYQRIKLADGTSGSSVMAKINPDGSFNASVIGTPVVNINGTPSISGAVTVVGTPSISGTINIGTIPGSVVGFQGGSWSSSIVTFLAPSSSFVSGVTSIMTQTTPTSVLVAAGANIKNYVTHILCTNGAAAGTFVDIKDGGGNVLYSGYAAASGGGFSAYIYPPIVGSANKSIDAVPRTQASVIVAITGYTA